MRAVGLSTQVWNNNWRCAFLLAGFPLLLAMSLFGLSLIFTSEPDLARAVHEAARQFPWFLLGGSILAGVWFAIAWLGHQRMIAALAGARPVTRDAEPELWNSLEEIAISRGEPMPRLAVIETDALNAFASGLRREDSAVTVTRGLMRALDRNEMRAVLAHEVAHIRNGDARLGVVAAIFAGILSLLAEMLMRSRFHIARGGSSNRRSGSGLAVIVGIVLIILAGALGTALRFALSRNREFQADATAVQMTADPDALIHALRKIEGRSAMPEVPAQIRAMFFDDEALSLGARFWATHPPIEDRVAALVRYAGGRDPGPLELTAPPPAAGEATPASPWADLPASPWAPPAKPPGPLPGGPWGPKSGSGA